MDEAPTVGNVVHNEWPDFEGRLRLLLKEAEVEYLDTEANMRRVVLTCVQFYRRSGYLEGALTRGLLAFGMDVPEL